MSQPVMLKKLKLKWFYEDLLELTPKKDVLFIIGDWDAKVGGKEVPGVTGKFGPGIQNEEKPTEFFSRECTGHSKHK